MQQSLRRNSALMAHCSLNGIYPVGSVNIDNKEDLVIKNISVAHNVSSLKILTKTVQTHNADFKCYTLNTQFLEDRKEEIFSISEIQTRLKYLLQYTHFVMDVLKRHHDSYAKSTSNIAREASNYIMNHNGIVLFFCIVILQVPRLYFNGL